MATSRRFIRHLVLTFFVILSLGAFPGVATAQRGVHVTPSGYRVPLHGVSGLQNDEGRWSTECARMTPAQVDAARFSRSLNRTMLRGLPRVAVRTVDDDEDEIAFEVIYSDAEGHGFRDAATGGARRQAFEASLMAWALVLEIKVPIVVQARMEEPDDEEEENGRVLLAAAGPTDFVVIEEMAIPLALASQWLGERAVQEQDKPDVEIVFNEAADWDYVINGKSEEDKVSFVYTTIHEMAHGLGFIDTFDPDTGDTLNAVPVPFDIFINRGVESIQQLIFRSSDDVKQDLTSNDLFFAGENAVAASRRSIRPLPMVKLYAPDPFEPGSSIAHVDQDTYADFKTGLMAPRDFGSGTDKIDILTLAIMADMGYTLIEGAETARTGARRSRP